MDTSYIGFIGFMLNDKSFLGYTNLFSPNDCEKNDKIILKNSMIKKIRKNILCYIW